MHYLWLLAALAFAALDWLALARRSRPLEYLAKPAVMLMLLGYLATTTGFAGLTLWFGLGVLFSLAGDVFLMLPREQFVAGLVSFLCAHLAYSLGLSLTGPLPLGLPSLILALLVGLTAWQLGGRITAGLNALGQRKLIGPVRVYAAVISFMLLAALLTLVRPEWGAGPSLAITAGALLFFVSDALLAWNKFVAPIRGERLSIHMTYHLGQILLVIGAAAQVFAGNGGS